MAYRRVLKIVFKVIAIYLINSPRPLMKLDVICDLWAEAYDSSTLLGLKLIQMETDMLP